VSVHEAAQPVDVRVPALPALPALPVASQRGWERTYVACAAAADAVSALAAAVLAYEVRFPEAQGAHSVLYPLLTLLLPVLWVAAMAAAGTYDRRFIGVGSEEFRRVVVAALGVISFVGTFSWATRAEIARGYMVIALPAATLMTLALRYALRKHVHRLRVDGRCVQRTLLVGPVGAVEDLAQRLGSAPHHGYQVIGACLTPHEGLPERRGKVPMLGELADVASAVSRAEADTVAVLACPQLDGTALRRLAWELEPTGADLIVAPTLVDVAGPRLSIRPVEGLPLLHVDHPTFTGLRRLLKVGFDRCLAGLALLLLSPLLAVIAVAVKLDSPGPVLFRQLRVGRLGQEFTILKFRSMVADAERRMDEVVQLNQGDGPLFKAHADPRVTRVGAFLRRTSLDELPQLVNVLLGQMSLVGPRPHLAAEVALFGSDMTRRMLVKPGLTGLWQVSGRSDLTWDESVRVDLRYVENWSFMLDVAILWKTLFVVLRRSGAY